MKKSHAGPPAASSTPPSAGPITRAMLNCSPLRTIASVSSSRGTSRGVNTCHAGTLKAITMPIAALSVMRAAMFIRSVAASTVRSRAITIIAPCVQRSSVRRFTRSATTPPATPSSIMGASCATACRLR